MTVASREAGSRELWWVLLVTSNVSNNILTFKDQTESLKAFKKFHVDILCKFLLHLLVINLFALEIHI